MTKRWDILPDAPQSFYDEHPELPRVVSQLLYQRGITEQEKIDEFLNPDYSQDIHDPYLFKDMKKAVARIKKAIADDESIIIHGDYDADGVSASVILTTVLRELGAMDVDTFLPHRETDGYGLNKKNVQMLADDGVTLIITCDCGVSNVEEIDLANELGVDVIVTDHHSIPETLPKAHAIIHPKIESDSYPDDTLCGAAVAFKLAQALLNDNKKEGKKLKSGEKHEACEKWLLGMVAIASVADMVPLLGESRTLTKYGLIVLNKTRRIGLQKLLLEARIMQDDGSMKKEINAETIGFQIAPRINAAGRMNHANVAYNLMMTNDPIEATDLAYELDKNNKDRRKLVDEMLKEAEDQLRGQEDAPILFVLGYGWSTGVVGLIAGKLKEKYGKPAIALANNNDEVTASGRSVDGFNLIESLQAIPEYFEKFGGHPMACGFTLKAGVELETFYNALREQYKAKTEGIDMSPKITVDATVEMQDVDWELYDLLQKFEPFGKDNENPLYASLGLEVQSVKAMGSKQNHLTVFVKAGTKVVKLIGWNLCGEGVKTNWCTVLSVGDKIDVVFDIGVNEWNGNRELQLTIRDLKKSEA